MAFERSRPAKQRLENFSLPPSFGGTDTDFDLTTREVDPLMSKAQRVLDGTDNFSFDDIQKALALLIVGKD